MSFKLTTAHVNSLFDPTAKGDWSLFLGAIDPEVHWTIADPVHDPKTLAGTYNLQLWTEKVAGSMTPRIQGLQSMEIVKLDVVGQKAIIEAKGTGLQKNGRPYNNRFYFIFVFSEETGKIVKIREYLNSALVKEVVETNDGL